VSVLIWRRFTRKGARVAHTLLASRPAGSIAAVCGIALSLRGDYKQAPESARDCVRCTARRTSERTRGEKIGRKVERSLYDPGAKKR
jgi:hypothetical protein